MALSCKLNYFLFTSEEKSTLKHLSRKNNTWCLPGLDWTMPGGPLAYFGPGQS